MNKFPIIPELKMYAWLPFSLSRQFETPIPPSVFFLSHCLSDGLSVRALSVYDTLQDRIEFAFHLW